MKKEKTFTLSWKPVRRGHIYCAPACGGDCTFKAYQDTHSKGKKLTKSLGKGWTYRVWENMGWFSECQSPCGRIRVSNNYGKHYMAFLGEVNGTGGRWAKDGKTAKSAIKNVIKVAKRNLAVIGAYIEGTEMYE